MSRQFRFSLGLAIFALTLPGCITGKYALPEASLEGSEQLDSMPRDSRSMVYVFIINGNDPLGLANLKGVKKMLTSLGFDKSYYGEIGNERYLAEELVCMNRDHPGSKFVVVGFEYGADSAARIATAGTKAGATIDMLMYLEPIGTFYPATADDPGIRRQVFVQNKLSLPRTVIADNLEVIKVDTSNRYGVPTQPEVLEVLTDEVSHLAMITPVVEYVPEPAPPLLDETVPPPRPLKDRKPEKIDEWDFLKVMSKKQRKDLPPLAFTHAEPPKIVEPNDISQLGLIR